MIDWPLIFVIIFALGVLSFIIYCIAVLIFTKPTGEKVTPPEIDTVDMIIFQHSDDR
ncbi:hypothetical protein CES85_4368 [Ochrobactrum quorumnocens]|uniref:Uncharacterized protein n=1 Tax=Ochrobactrum quorumnocens TaxID=271865 RepID=A0A248U9W6_9HYPH|nr:hypothetical protein CES85_4368 [[Ochrobactrum] quorumnocens]